MTERSRGGKDVESVGKLRVSDFHASDAEAYSEAVGGVDIDGVRAESGHGSTHVLVAREGSFISTSCQVGFPMLNRTTVDDDQILVACIERGSPGSQWCELDLEPGAVFVYGPEAEHSAINRPGLGFTFVATARETLKADAEQLGLDINIPERGSVERVMPSSTTSALLGAFLAFRRGAGSGPDTTGRLTPEVLPAIAKFLSEAAEDRHEPKRRSINRRHLVFKTIEYAEAVGRIPSLSELCASAHVSQRTLRRAFVSEFDVPPTNFFRIWALGRAHSRLSDADVGAESVTRVALDFGFTHLSRFAGSYQEIFGELPSETLAGRPTPTSPATRSVPGQAATDLGETSSPSRRSGKSGIPNRGD